LITLIISGCSDNEGQIGRDAPKDSVPDILGTYIVNGTDHLGNDYGGHLTITAGENPSEYKFQWIIIESIQEGIGILNGNQLQIQWHSIDTSTESYSGAVTYTVTINSELYGKRTVDGRKGEGMETAYPNQ
jgi:hypothetical protein